MLNDLIVQVSKNISLAGALDEGNTATVLLKLAEVADLPDVFEFSFGQISKNVRYRELVAILLICHLMEAGIDLAPDDMSRDDAEKILRLLDLMPSFSYNSYLA